MVRPESTEEALLLKENSDTAELPLIVRRFVQGPWKGTFAVTGGSEVESMMVPTTPVRSTVALPATYASTIALRSEPGPWSSVLPTTEDATPEPSAERRVAIRMVTAR